MIAVVLPFPFLPLLLVLLLSSAFPAVSALTVRTPATAAHFANYIKSNPTVANNIVAKGGWYALEQQVTAQLAKQNYIKIRQNMEHTTSFDIVAAGGYDTTIALAADPKGVLVQYIQQQKHEIVPTSYLTAIVGLLQAQGKGFESDLVDGEWISVMNVSGKASPKIQKIIAKMEQLTYSNFDCHQGIFTGNAKLLFGQGDLGSTVKFTPIADNLDKFGNKIILRRIACDIVGASWKFWRFPRIPLPLKKKGGFLDFCYLDQDIRITKGNRGGIFVHVRPAFFKHIATKSNK